MFTESNINNKYLTTILPGKYLLTNIKKKHQKTYQITQQELMYHKINHSNTFDTFEFKI